MIFRPTGPRNAKIAIVGESLGPSEIKAGIPFVGNSGRFLSKLLHQSGIQRSDCYITNVLKSVKTTDVSKISVAKNEIVEEIHRVNPNLTIALGNLALNALTGLDNISKRRGSIYKNPKYGFKVLVTLHPSYLLRVITDTPLVLSDLARAKEESLFPDFRNIKERTYTVPENFGIAVDLLEDLKKAKCISLDIETNMGATVIYCVGMAKNDHCAVVIPFWSGKAVWSKQEEKHLWNLIREILTDPDIYKIIQNEHFEKTVLYNWVGEVSPVLIDTMIGHHLCYPEIKKSLAVQTSIYTNEPYYKDTSKGDLYKYNAKDCTVTYEIAMTQLENIKSLGMESFLYGYQMQLSRIMWIASMVGMSVDVEAVLKLRTEYKNRMKVAQDRLNKITYRNVNAKSPKQVAQLIYIDLKIPKLVRRGVGSISTDEESLLKLYKKYPLEEIMLILEIRKTSKILGTYLCDFWDRDFRVHSNWVITGTETGRLSSRKNITGTGLNMQNIPKNIRNIFRSDINKSLIKIDLSQAEARIVAYLAEDLKMMQVFETGQDIHSMVASWLFGVSIDDVKNNERELAKKLVHGANYGLSATGFSKIADIHRLDASELLRRYYNTFNIKKWHSDIKNSLSINRKLKTPLGRQRQFSGWWGEQLFREAYAYIPQSTCSDYINMKAVRIFYRLPKDAHILLQIHDEIVIQVKDTDIDETLLMLEEELSIPIKINNHDVVLPVDIKTDKVWS